MPHQKEKKRKKINKKKKKCNNLLTVPSLGVIGEHLHEERTLYTLENTILLIKRSP